METDSDLESKALEILKEYNLNPFATKHNYCKFAWACRNGYLVVVQWLHKEFDTTLFDAFVWDSNILVDICFNGHLNILKWLYETSQVNARQIRSRRNYGFRMACKNGHVELAKYLAATFELTKEDICSYDDEALEWAIEGGYTEIIEWLHDTYYERFDFRRAFQILRDNCILGHLSAIQWVYQRYYVLFSVKDIQICDNWILRSVCKNGHLNILLWLHETFRLPKNDLCGLLEIARENNRTEIVKWILEIKE